MLYPQNENQIEIFITTRREGLLTKVGHDLLLLAKVSSFEVEEQKFKGEIRAMDIEILGALENGKASPMSKGDTSKILKTMQKDVFKSKRYPLIRFSGTFSDPLLVHIHLRDQEGEIKLHLENETWKGVLDHSKYGISQVKALFGTLKVNPLLELEVRISPPQ